MRTVHSLSLAVLLLSACDDAGTGAPDAAIADPAASFNLVTADVVIAPGDERTHCYYTSLPIDRTVGVERWSSIMTPGSHHMIMYALPSTTTIPDGTLVEDCSVLGEASAANIPVWVYSAQTPEAEFAMPEGVGMTLEA